MSLAERRWLRLGMLCAFYVAQGIPWAFTAITIPSYLNDRHVDPAAVGTLLAATTLPYSFKWIWGVIVDSFTIPRWGRRRPWILLAQLLMALTILAMALLPDLSEDVKLLAIVVMVHTVFNALQDVAVDALAVDLLAEDERGRANGLMYASKYVGGIIGGSGLSWVIAEIGLRPALIGQTVVLLAIMIVPAVTRETPRPVEERPRVRDVARGLVEVFSVRSALVTGVMMLTVNMALGMLTANGFALFIQELQWSPEKYTSLTGGFGLACGFAGAVSGGFLSDLIGRKRLAAIASLSLAGGWLAFGLLTRLWNDDFFIYGLAMFEAFAAAVLTVTMFALCMDVSWARVGASQFTAYMAFANISTTMGFRLASTMTEHFSYAECYVIAAAVQAAVTVWLLAIDPRQTSRELPRPEGAPLPIVGVVAVCALGVTLTGFTIYVLRPLL